MVIKNFPLTFHKQARLTAEYCLATKEQGGVEMYKKIHDKIFENYKMLKTNPELPLQFAENLGLDIEKLKADAKSVKITSLIDKEINQMKTAGIPRLSVPKFLINGKEPQGRSLEVWSAIIDDELKK